MAKKRLVYFTDGQCAPCEEVGKLLEQQRVSNSDIDNIEVVDIGTDAGFQKFHDMVLSKEDAGVPRAYLDGKRCQIEILEDDTVYFNCPSNDHPAGPAEISSPPAAGAPDDVAQSGPPDKTPNPRP